MFPRLQEPFRHIFLGDRARSRGWRGLRREDVSCREEGPALAISGFARGALTGAVIGGILTSFDALILNGPPGAPLRRATFAAHVVDQDCHLPRRHPVRGFKLGEGSLFPAPGDNGIQSGDVLFSLAAGFVFAFIVDVNSLLGQNMLINFIAGVITRHAWNRGCSCSSTWWGRRDWPNGSALSPSIARQKLHRRSHPADRRGTRRNPSLCRRRADRDLEAR